MPTKKRKRQGEANGSTVSKLKKKGSVREAIPDVDEDSFASNATAKDGRKWSLKLASWNVNGIRAWVEKNGHSYITAEKPDIVCVQEIKCEEEKIPSECKLEGYHTYWSSATKKGYAGTGLYSKEKPINVTYGIGKKEHDDEGRTITAELENFYVVTTYVPNAGRGLVRLDYRSKEWDKDFLAYLQNLDAKKPVIWCGDLNVAHQEIDLKNPKNNEKSAGFTPQERKGFGNVLKKGFVDTFRDLYPDKEGAYSYWSYMGGSRAKNVGWRLDYFVVSARIMPDVCDSLIRSSVMGSDHCPIVLLLAK